MMVKYLSVSFFTVAVLVIGFFCTDPIKPDFSYTPEISGNGTIKTFGSQNIDSLFGMYVVVAGTGPLTFEWFKNDTLDTSATKDTLLFAALSFSDSGKYFCVVSNEAGSDTSTVYSLMPMDTMPKPPVLADDGLIKAFGTLANDSSFGMYVSATGTETIIYKWVKNGTIVPNVSDDTLYLPSLELADSGNYFCVVFNNWGIDSSKIFKLHFGNFAPQWLHDTLHLDVYEGNEYSLSLSDSCVDINNDSIFYLPVSFSSPIGDTIINGIYTITPSFDDAGAYIFPVGSHDIVDTSFCYFALNIINVNQPPEFLVEDSLPSEQYEVAEMDTLVIPFKAVDKDNDTVYYFLSATTLPDSTTISFSDSMLKWYAPVNSARLYNVKLGAYDYADTEYVTILIAVGGINLPPVLSIKDALGQNIAEFDTIKIKEEKSFFCFVAASDVNSNDTAYLTPAANTPFSINSNVAGNYDTTTGIFTCSPSFAVSSAQTNTVFSSVTFFALDKFGGRDTFIVHIEVIDSNSAPQCQGMSHIINEDSVLTVNIPAVDAEDDTISWSFNSSSLQGGSVNINSGTINSAAEFTYTAANIKQAVTDIIIITLSDSSLTTTALCSITVIGVNEPPTPSTINTIQMVEDQSSGVSVNITATDPEDGTAGLNWFIVQTPEKCSPSAISGNISPVGSEFTLIPKQDSCGIDSFSFSVSDAENNIGDTVIVQVNITPVNDKPEISITNINPSIQSNFNSDVYITTSYRDPEGIESIFLIVDNSIVLTSAVTDLVGTYIFTWNEPFHAHLIKTYSIKAVVRDDAGASDTTFPQNYKILGTYQSDSLSVRAILDSNGRDETVEEVTKTGANGRIDTLGLGTLALNKLVPEIGNLDKLQYLDLWDNSLTSLLPEIGNLGNLQLLNLQGNKLTSLPPEIGNLGNLQVLSLVVNPLTTLPPEIGNLVNLQKLELEDNSLTSLPAEIGNLVNLTEFELNGNSLTTLPNSVTNIVNSPYCPLYQNKLDTTGSEPWQVWADSVDPDWRITQNGKKRSRNQKSVRERRDDLLYPALEHAREKTPGLLR